MPSFDIVSKTNLAEIDNAINGALKEISNRYDFKESKSEIKRENDFETKSLKYSRNVYLREAISLWKYGFRVSSLVTKVQRQ